LDWDLELHCSGFKLAEVHCILIGLKVNLAEKVGLSLRS
jgi:hypothetical protein